MAKGFSNSDFFWTPKICTPAAEKYYRTEDDINGFYWWIVAMAHSVDTTFKVNVMLATAEEIETHTEEKAYKGDASIIDLEGPMSSQFKHNSQLIFQLLLCRHVDNYLNYLTELLGIIFKERPETLSPLGTVDLADVVQHSTMEEFIEAEAERRVRRHSYKSFDELNDFFDKTMKLTLFRKNEITNIVEAVEIRNISVHNRCIIDERYCHKTHKNTDLIGTQRSLDVNYLRSVTRILNDGVKKLDLMARKKFDIRGKKYSDLRNLIRYSTD